MPARWTHVAIRVASLERTLAFYRRWSPLREIHRRREDDGSQVAWLGDPVTPGFVVVFAEVAGQPAERASFNHLGFSVDGRPAVDAIAAEARIAGVLAYEPSDLGPVVGYLTQLRDPDGNILEFSHGQRLG